MQRIHDQRGFSAVEAAIVIAVVALLAIGGYFVFNRQDSGTADKQNSTEQSAEAKDVPAAPEISSKEDLDTAETTLNEADLDASNTDAGELDKELTNF